MKTPLSPQDWQNLSAYLDHQLSTREQAHLEERLIQQPELREGLEELRETRLMLRSVPRRKLPHAFTLTRAMAAEQSRRRSIWAPVFGVSSLASFLLLIVSILFALGPRAAQVAMQEAPAAPVPTAQIVYWGGLPAAEGMGGGGGGDVGTPLGMGGGEPSPQMKAEAAQPLQAPQATQVPMAVQKAMPTETTLPDMRETPTDIPRAMDSTTANEPSGGGNPILGIRPTNEQGQMLPTVVTASVERAENQPTAMNSMAVWRMALLILSLLTGAAALFLWRRSHK